MMQWLNDNSGAIVGLATIAVSVVTLVYAIFTRSYVRLTKQSIGELEQQRKNQNLPFLTTECIHKGPEVTGQRQLHRYAVRNHGWGPAVDVKATIKFDDGSRDGQSSNLDQLVIPSAQRSMDYLTVNLNGDDVPTFETNYKTFSTGQSW